MTGGLLEIIGFVLYGTGIWLTATFWAWATERLMRRHLRKTMQGADEYGG